MNDDEFEMLLLTRQEAAKYKGLAGEQSVRDAEGRGAVACAGFDPDGRAMFRKPDLDAWQVKAKEPTHAQKMTVLRGAARAREQEAHERARKQQAENERLETEFIARRDAWRRAQDTRRALEGDAEERNRCERDGFLREHINEAQARTLLGLRGEMPEGLLKVDVPTAWCVGAVHVGGSIPQLERGWTPIAPGVFYRRADVDDFARAFAAKREPVGHDVDGRPREDEPSAMVRFGMAMGLLGPGPGVSRGVTKVAGRRMSTPVGMLSKGASARPSAASAKTLTPEALAEMGQQLRKAGVRAELIELGLMFLEWLE